MAAFRELLARRVFFIADAAHSPVSNGMTMPHIASRLTRPKLVMRWQVGEDGRLTRSWVEDPEDLRGASRF